MSNIFLSGYTIRTETTVRTTEIKFHLGKTFSESTIDGRITDTTPIRDKNVMYDEKVEEEDDLTAEEIDSILNDFEERFPSENV